MAFPLIFPWNVRNAINCDFDKLRHFRPISLPPKIFSFPKIVIRIMRVSKFPSIRPSRDGHWNAGPKLHWRLWGKSGFSAFPFDRGCAPKNDTPSQQNDHFWTSRNWSLGRPLDVGCSSFWRPEDVYWSQNGPNSDRNFQNHIKEADIYKSIRYGNHLE